MKVNGFHRSAIALAVYLATFVGLVLIQFSRADKRTERAGALELTVLDRGSEATDSGDFPDELRLFFKGMTFVFGKGLPLGVKNVTGDNLALLPLSWRPGRESVDVYFERRLSLSFTAPSDGAAFSVTARSPETEIASVILPYGLSGASLEESKEEGISLRSKSSAYGLNLGGGTRLDAEGHSLLVQNGDGVFRLTRKAEAPRPAATKAPAAAAKLSPMDPEEYRGIVEAWLESSWKGLSRDRLVLDQSGWKTGSVVEFSEKALLAYAAEARERGAWEQHSSSIAALSKANAARLSWRSSPYFGKLQLHAAALLEEDQALARKVKDLADARDPALFLLEDLTPFLVDRAPVEVARAAFDFAQTLDPEELGPEAACAYALCMSQAEELLPGSSNPFRAAAGLLDKTVPRAIVLIPEGAFLCPDGKTASMAFQLRLGFALAGWGAAKASPKALAQGQRLVAAALSLADGSGILPAEIVVSGKAITSRSGVLAPEDIYPYASENPWYPRQVSLREMVGPGTWAWTSATSLTAEANAASVMIRAGFETGSAHYLAIFGIRPFAQIKLYDIPYRAATDFEIYNASGYLYQRSSSLLLVKLKHKKETELIELDY